MAEQPFTVIDIDVEDDATFDTDTLVVDGTNNRVGILVAAPTVTFDVLGTSLFTGTAQVTSNLTLGSGGTTYTFPTTDGGSGEALVSDGGGTLSFTAVGAGSVTSVGITPGSGISVSGSPITTSGSITVTNIGVTSIVAGSNISISGATGAVTINSTDQYVGTVTSVATSSGTFVDVTGGPITTTGTITGDLSASGTASATTFLRGDNTWSTPSGTYTSWTLAGDSGSSQTISDSNTATFAGGTGISTVAGLTDLLTITNTGVTSNVAGTGIGVSGATGAVTITNSGVTSIVAGTNVSISGATGAVTINSTDQYDGTVTSVGSGTGLSGGPITTSGTLNLDLDSLGASGTLIGTDNLAVVDGTTSAKTQISTIPLSIFNNDSGWTSNTGTVTSVATSNGTFVDVTGGTITGSGTITGDLSATGTASGSTFLRGDNTWSAVPGGYTSWSLTGDAGTTEVVADGNIVDIAGGTGITTTASATDTLTVALDNTAVSAGSYTYSSFTVDAQGRLTAASSGSSPGTMDDWVLTGDTGSQTITDGDTVAVVGSTGIDADVTATDTLTITNTGVTSNVAGTGISVSGATGAVTITNSGVTSIVAGTNVSISGATGAVTINSTDQYDGTVTSVATSSGTFVDVSGGTITATGTITADLSATGTASSSTYLRGDNSWATIAGDITDVNAGTGLSGGGSSGSVTLSVDYLGTDNFIDVATDLEGTPIAAADSIVYHDTGDNNVKKGLVSDLPFSSTSGTVTSVAASGGTGISISGSPITTSGTITIGNTGVTSNVAGTGISVSGATGAVTITNAGVTGVTGGEGIDTTGSTGSITLTLDLDELTTTTTSSNADFFPIVNSGAAQFKIAPSDIDLSTFNNDSGWTTNAGTVTSVATSNGTFVNVTGGTITGSGTITGDLSATGTASASTYLRGDNTWAAVPGGYTDWTLAGDSGANQTISDGNTATIAGGTALSTVGSATDTLTINLDNTAVSAGSYTYGSFTVDAQGRLTAASSGSSPGTMSSFSLTGDTGTPQTISDGDTVDIAGGTGLSSVAAATDTVTLSLDNTAVSAGSYTYSSITVDAQGRLTSASSGSAPGTMSSFALDGDSGSTQTISDGDTMDIAGGTGISTVASATDTVTITNTGVTSAVASTGISVSGATGAVTFTNTGVTSIVAGSNISISGATGAVTISSTDQFTGTVTSVATSSGTFVDVTGGTFTTSGTITGDLSATGTASATTFLRGDNTWSTPTGAFSDFIISDGSTTQTIADGDTLLFSTGTGVSAVVSATDTLTITNTGVTSNVAGSGIGVSASTGAVTITNSGVTSIVAGTNVSISGATGAVTISSADQYTGTVTSVATSNGTFVNVSGGTITSSGTITGDLSATGTASASTFLRGDNTWSTPSGSYSSWDLAGDTGSAQQIDDGNTATIAGGTGLSSVASATDTVTLSLDNTAVSAGSYTYSSITVDAQGRLTAASSGSSPGTMSSFTLTADSGVNQTINDGNSVDIAGGTGIATVVSATDTVTVTNTGVTSNVAGTGISVSGATGAVTITNSGVTSIVAGTNVSISGATGAVTINSTDQFTGTVTSVATSSGTFVDVTGGTFTTSGTITGDLSATGTASASTFLRGDNTWATPSGSYTSWTLSGDSGSNQAIADGNTVDIAGGTGISTVASATDTLTVTLDDTAVTPASYTYSTITVDQQGRLTAASSGSSPGTMSSFSLSGDSGTPQTISDGDTMDIEGGTGIATVASATDKITVTNTGVTSNVAGTGISVSGATGAVTIANTGVTSIVAGTNVSISGATGAVTINSTDQYVGTVTSVATSSGTFVDITGGTITTAGTITSDLSATGTASASTFLRGDNTWATPTGSVGGSNTEILYNDSGAQDGIPIFTYINTATSEEVILEGTSDQPLMRITQLGTGDALLIEDSTNPDATPFKVNGDGNVAIGGASYGNKLQVHGDVGFTTTDFYIGGASGQFKALQGTAAAPYYTTNGDTNTGMYNAAADTLGFSTAGVNAFQFGPSGQFGIGGATYGTAGQVLSSGGASAVPTWEDAATGTVTSVATSSGTFVDVTGGTFTTSGTITGDLSATGTASASTFLRGDNTWATPAGGGTMSSWILAGDSGTQTISDGNTATVAGGTGLTSVAAATDTVTLNLDNTAVSAGSYTYASLTVDAQGRLTSASSGSSPGTMDDWVLTGDSGTQTITDGNTVDIAGGTGITTTASATDTLTVDLDNTAVSAGSYTYSSLTVDAQGRLTAASSGSSPGTMSSFTAAGSSGPSQTISDGNTFTIAQGTGITSVASATDTITITNTGVTSNVAGSGISVSGATGAVTIANTGVTSIVAGTNVSISGATGAVTINSTDQYVGTVTSVATGSGTFVDITGGTITTSGTISGDLSATGTASASTFLRGDNTWSAPAGGFTSFDLSGDSGSAQTITDGNTVDIAGGTGISTVAGATDTVTITNTGVTSAVAGTAISVSGATGAVTITNTGVTSAVAGTGIDVSGATGAVTITTDVSDFMTNGVNNRVLTATGTDAMNAEVNMTFDGSTLDVLGAGRTYQGSTTIFAGAATTALTAAAYAGKYLIKTHTSTHTFNLPAASSVGEHYTIVYGPAATTTSGQVTITAGAGDNITWYDGSASVYANSIGWTPKAGSAITIICSVASSAWVAIGTDQ